MMREENQQPNEKKKKILTPLELLKEKQKGEKEVQEYRKLKFQKSRAGKILRFVSGFKSNLQSQLRGQVSPEERKRRALILLSSQLERQRIQQQRQSQEQSFFNWVFRAGDMEALKVERELSGFNALHSEGDRVANVLNNKALNVANMQHINPSFAVNQEALFHANRDSVMPLLRVDSEVSKLANLQDVNVLRKLDEEVTKLSRLI